MPEKSKQDRTSGHFLAGFVIGLILIVSLFLAELTGTFSKTDIEKYIEKKVEIMVTKQE